VDIIYDCVGIAGTGDFAYQILRDGGKFVTLQTGSLASSQVAASRPEVSQFHFIQNHSQTKYIDLLRGLVEKEQLFPVIDSTYTLDSIPQAFERAMEGHTVGKIAVQIAMS